jgi:hypothetical protein
MRRLVFIASDSRLHPGATYQQQTTSFLLLVRASNNNRFDLFNAPKRRINFDGSIFKTQHPFKLPTAWRFRGDAAWSAR